MQCLQPQLLAFPEPLSPAVHAFLNSNPFLHPDQTTKIAVWQCVRMIAMQTWEKVDLSQRLELPPDFGFRSPASRQWHRKELPFLADAWLAA